jgi:hypothetical protein
VLAAAALAQLAVYLLLADRLELTVVVEQAHVVRKAGAARRGPARPGPEGLRGPLGHERRPRSHDDEAAMAITAWSRRSARALPAPDRGRRPAHQHPDVVEPPQDDEREQERDLMTMKALRMPAPTEPVQ